MNTRLLTLLALAFFTITLSSCVSSHKAAQSSAVVSREVTLDPLKADIVVDETKKLKGESSASYFLCFKVNGDRTVADGITYSVDASASVGQRLNPFKLINRGRLNKTKGAAAHKAMLGGDYDVLVHPTYLTTVQNYILFKKYKVVVEGYGAKYENFRTERQKIVILEDGKEIILQD